MNEVLCVGMAVIDILAKGVKTIRFGGHTEFVDSVSMSAGGDALNQAIVLSKLGHRPGLLSMVGSDAQGEYLINECKKNQVDVNGVVISDKYPTSTSMVLITPDGERSFISQKNGTVDEFCLSAIHFWKLIPGIKVVSIGSLFCSPKFDAQAGELLAKAKKIGAYTVADTVPNKTVSGISELRDVLPFLDYFIPSREEALFYTGKETVLEAAELFMEYGASTVIVKQGREGALLVTKYRKCQIPAYPGEAVDATGAGDNFVAGFIAGLLRDKPVDKCLEIASATASIAIRSVGATTGVRNFGQVQGVIDNSNIGGNNQ
jgi:sugar/nucleoside kinase (ribokinase family)